MSYAYSLSLPQLNIPLNALPISMFTLQKIYLVLFVHSVRCLSKNVNT